MANNGVVVVTADKRVNFDATLEPARIRGSVDAANACVNFAAYDSNNDGTITNLELVIMHVTAPSSAAENCGAARGITAGANDYFLVENRQQTTGAYDASAADNGLVIWRIDDAQHNSADQNVRPIDIMRPDGTTNGGCDASGNFYGGSNGDAWNPSDAASPQRTMSRTWRDGAASLVAVRAIGPSGDVIRAYFDVRGPGVMVDPTIAQGVPLQFDVTPEEANPVSFTVMNTGEATDTFDFSVVGLPAGWTSSTHNMSLAAGAGSTANVSITVPANAATGLYTVRAHTHQDSVAWSESRSQS